MPMQWDPLLLAALARELHERLAGRRTRALLFDPSRRTVLLHLREETLAFDLHPARGGIFLLGPAEPGEGAIPLSGRLRSVRSLPDDRVLVVEVERRGARREVVCEFLGTRWNAAVTEGPDRIVRHLLVPREGGARPVRSGFPWTPPEPTGRLGVEGRIAPEAWPERARSGIDRGEARRTLLRTVAWTSSLNAESLLGPDGPERWQAIVDPERWGAFVLHSAKGPQPYPVPLEGIPSEAAPSLLQACTLARASEAGMWAPEALLLPGALLERLERRILEEERRAAALHRELEATEDPSAERALGDLILARFGEIPRGADRVRLTGFDGTPVELALDPTLAPHENADRHYRAAARWERARTTLPERIREAEAEAARRRELLAAALEGRVSAGALAAELGPEPAVPSTGRGRSTPTLPYRRYRSTGGLEIRVGRGARQNDDLTFHHADPDDVWLHAQQAPGAHVVLRWGREDNPPRADLEEAALLAALHSEARHAGRVSVLWTRRKHVRKPRKAPPGSVRPERVRTLVVEPDAERARSLLPEDG